MKKNYLKYLIVSALLIAPGAIFAQAPNLGTAANFVLFTGTGAVTNTGISHLTGNVGTNSGSNTGFGNVDGSMHSGDGVSGAAITDLNSAYIQLNNATPAFFPGALLGNGATLTAGVYKINSAAVINGALVLDGQGDQNAVFIFQVQGPLAVNTLSSIILVNGARACNIFWKVEGLVTMGVSSTMRGTIVAHNAAIAMSANDTLEGRALSTTGAITLNGLTGAMPLGAAAVLTGPAAPTLASIACYGVFSSNGSVTNTGATHIVGDVGTNSGLTTGFNPLFVTGTIHPVPDASTATCAADLQTVYNYLTTLPYDIELLYPAQFGNELSLTPNTYIMNSATTFTGNLYLNAEGNVNAVFIIKVNGAITTSTFSKVILINGAQAKNVYWKVEGAVSINDYSLFNGTVVINNGALNLATGDTLNGRALSTTGAVSTTAIIANITAGCGIVCTVAPITGPATACKGTTTTFTDNTTGGKWTSSNTAVATIDSFSGIATAVTGGTTNITYTTGAACFALTTFTVYNPPAAITGTTSICKGSATTLGNTGTGGTWSSSNPALAAISSTGLVTGILAGTSLITYTAPTGCTTSVTFTVDSGTYSGTIAGPSSVCTGSSIILTDNVSGGTWGRSNATATVTNGVVTGITAGIDNISYTVTNSCGTATSVKPITVNTQSAPVTGPSQVCTGATITLANTGSGGSWSSSNTAQATVNSTSGLVSGIAAGTPVITYTASTGCTSTMSIVVNTTPVAIVPANQFVCNGATAGPFNFTSTTGGTTFTWVNNNTSTSINASGTGNIPAFTATNSTNNPETATIQVTPATNTCTGSPSIFTVTIDPTPVVVAPANLVVCNNELTGNINFTSPVAGTAYTWANTNTSIGLAASGTGNIASFAAANTTTTPIMATVTVTPSANGCSGTAQSFTITVNPTPHVNAVADQALCNNATTAPVNFTSPVAGATYSWINNNTSIGLPANGTGDIASFTATNTTAAAITGNITVTPIANSCIGSPLMFSITVNVNPEAPVLALTTPSTLCDSTYFRNFGAATLPPAGMKYSWSTENAAISDTGSTTQYALVNFKTVGEAKVILTVNNISTTCSNSVSYSVTVGNTIADAPAPLIYFNQMFICLQNTEESYTWGYDDAATLAPTMLTGEHNQDYDNANPNFEANNYWVMVAHNGCIQKTYYNKPVNALMKLASPIVTVSPNPASNNVQVEITGANTGDMQMEILNMLGQKKLSATIANNKAQVNIAGFAPGAYLINCYRDGIKISATHFIKN